MYVDDDCAGPRAGTPGQRAGGLDDYLDADLRQDEHILDHAGTRLYFSGSRSRSCGIGLVLHLIGPEDDPYGIVRLAMAVVLLE